jgi:hypothetical protein
LKKTNQIKKQVFITPSNSIPISNINFKCSCFHNIKNLICIFSKSTGYSMIIGNCCVRKFFINNDKIINKLKYIEKQRKENKKKELKHKI